MFSISDIIDFRLQFAKDLGADCILKVNPNDDEKATAEKIKDMLGGMPEVTIDCSGYESTIKLAIAVSKFPPY